MFNRATGRSKDSRTSEVSRRAARRSHAMTLFRPTPVASNFEVKFASRFYAYAEGGGTPNIDRFPGVLRRTRLAAWLIAASVTTTLVAIPIYPSMGGSDAQLHWSQSVVASWLTSALLLAVPFTVAIVTSRRRFTRRLAEMNEDRSAYVTHMRAEEATYADTERRLRALGINI